MNTPRNISGDEWRDRVEAIARGDQTLEKLAEEAGVSYQAMKQFSARNSAAIAARRAELQAELHTECAALWVSDKRQILAYYKIMLDRLRPLLTDPDLDERSRSRFNRDAKALLHDCSELEGLLQARSKVELEVLNAELPAPGTMWGPISAEVASDS